MAVPSKELRMARGESPALVLFIVESVEGGLDSRSSVRPWTGSR